MLVLFESAAGYSLFKVLDEGKLRDIDGKKLHKEFASPEAAASAVKLQAFRAFDDTAAAISASTALVESKMDKSLKKFLKKNVQDVKEELAVMDAKLGGVIKEKLKINCVADEFSSEILRGIRSQIDSLVEQKVSAENARSMALGLAHTLSRYKLKFTPDKVDTMIVQAINLLDE